MDFFIRRASRLAGNFSVDFFGQWLADDIYGICCFVCVFYRNLPEFYRWRKYLEQLLIKCWGYDYEGEARVVDTHIKRLREKLGACADGIKTVIKAGYRLEG